MSRSEPEELLWELSGLDQEDGLESTPAVGESPDAPANEIPDAVLTAYRASTLSAQEERRVEVRLGRSPVVRERLAELAGMAPPVMSESARQRFLLALGASARRRAVPLLPIPAHPAWLLAVAAALVALVGTVFVMSPRGPVELPSLPSFDASIHGLAEVRDGGGTPASGSRFTTAEADTAVTVGVVVQPPRTGLTVGLYTLRPDPVSQRGKMVRLPFEPTWETRSTAVFRAPASALVGRAPGTYQLFAVIAREGGLPPDRILAPGEGPEVAFAGRDLKVEPLRLEIVHGADPGQSRASPNREANEP